MAVRVVCVVRRASTPHDCLDQERASHDWPRLLPELEAAERRAALGQDAV
jgi:hypothetical protein